jgi:hypothetical protein
VKALASYKSVLRNFSTPNVSSTNGLGENVMKKVKKTYTAVRLEHKIPGQSWDKISSLVQYALLTSPVGKNGLSAFQLLFRMDMRTPVHVLFQEHAKKGRMIKVLPLTDRELEHLKECASAFRYGEQLISGERQGKHAERVARSVTGGISLPLELASFVLLASGEKGFRWDQMGQIVDRKTHWIYKVELLGSEVQELVHVQNLRPCFAANYELSLDDKETMLFLELESSGIAGVESFRINPKGLEARVVFRSPTTPKVWRRVSTLTRAIPLLLTKCLATTLCANVEVKAKLELLLK